MKLRQLVRAAAVFVVLGVFYHGTSYSGQPEAEWSIPIDISYPDAAGMDVYPVLLCDQYQNLHVLWTKSYGTGSAIYYRSDTGGVWSEPVAVVAVPDPLAVGLSAAISRPDGVLHVIWQTSYIRGNVYYSQASLFDAGNARAWNRPQILVSAPDAAAINVDTTGVVRVWYGASDDTYTHSEVLYIESQDGGSAWSDPVTAYSTRTPTPSMITGGLVVDEAGRIHMTVSIRSQSYGAYSELLYLRSTDGGHTWQREVVAGPDTTSPGVAVLALFAFGRNEIHRTWHNPQRMHQWSLDGGETWSKPVEIMSLGAGFGGRNELVTDSAGVLHVVTAVGSGVFSAAFDGSEWMAPERIEARSMDPHSQTIEVCQGNQLHVAYDDRIGDDTTVWYSSREVNAPHIEQMPVPRAALQATAVATGEVNATAIPTPAAVTPPTSGTRAVSPQSSSAATTGNSFMLLLVPAGSVLIFLASVFLFRVIRQRRK